MHILREARELKDDVLSRILWTLYQYFNLSDEGLRKLQNLYSGATKLAVLRVFVEGNGYFLGTDGQLAWGLKRGSIVVCSKDPKVWKSEQRVCLLGEEANFNGTLIRGDTPVVIGGISPVEEGETPLRGDVQEALDFADRAMDELHASKRAHESSRL